MQLPIRSVAVPTRQPVASAPAPDAIPLAVLSLGAAAIHVAVIPEHLTEWVAAALFFAALGGFQALWAVAYVVSGGLRVRRLGWLVNAATVGLWVVSRTVGLPIGPEPWTPEAIGAPDVVASLLELGLVVGLLVPTAAGRRRGRSAVDRA